PRGGSSQDSGLSRETTPLGRSRLSWPRVTTSGTGQGADEVVLPAGDWPGNQGREARDLVRATGSTTVSPPFRSLAGGGFEVGLSPRTTSVVRRVAEPPAGVPRRRRRRRASRDASGPVERTGSQVDCTVRT